MKKAREEEKRWWPEVTEKVFKIDAASFECFAIKFPNNLTWKGFEIRSWPYIPKNKLHFPGHKYPRVYHSRAEILEELLKKYLYAIIYNLVPEEKRR